LIPRRDFFRKFGILMLTKHDWRRATDVQSNCSSLGVEESVLHFQTFHIEPRETLSPLDRRLDIDAVTIPRMIKVLSEEFDPAGRRLLFCESANLRLWPCRGVGLNCRILAAQKRSFLCGYFRSCGAVPRLRRRGQHNRPSRSSRWLSLPSKPKCGQTSNVGSGQNAKNSA
jgi:hypothetical protein